MNQPIQIPLREYLDLLLANKSPLIKFASISREQALRIQSCKDWNLLCAMEENPNGIFELYRLDEFKAIEDQRKAKAEYYNQRRLILLQAQHKIETFCSILAQNDPRTATFVQDQLTQGFIQGKPSNLDSLGLLEHPLGDLYREYHSLTLKA